MACSQCDGIEEQFNAAEARTKLRRLHRKGPDKTTRLLIEGLREALDRSALRDAVLLDVGAGIGAIHHELLNGRVAHAIHVDASTAHIAVAREESERRNHSGRVEFVRGDFVEVTESLAGADVVTLDRVICCYHDMNRLVRLSAARARRFYGAVYPRGVWWMRLAFVGGNLLLRLKRSAFRIFTHDPSAIDEVLRAEGFRRQLLRRTIGWEVVVYERTG